MSSSLSPAATNWAASAVVKEMSDCELERKYSSKAEAATQIASRLTTCGLKVFTIKELKWIWSNLKHKEFVYDNKHGYKSHMSGQIKKEEWVSQIHKFLILPEAAQLVPYSTEDENTTSVATAFVPPSARRDAPGHPASAPRIATQAPQQLQSFHDFFQSYHHLMSPGFPGMTTPFASGTAPAAAHSYARHLSAPAPRSCPQPGLPHALSPCKRKTPPCSSSTNVASLGSVQAHTIAHNSTYQLGAPALQRVRLADVVSPRKRKAPPSGSSSNNDNHNHGSGVASLPSSSAAANPWAGMPPDFVAFAAALQKANGSSRNPTVDTDPEAASKKSLENKLLLELQQMGFSDNDECLAAIRRAVDADGEPPTSDSIMMDIITAREEKEEARKMDQARLLSEQDRKEEAERLREQRRRDEEERLLNATYDEFLNPQSAEDQKLLFSTSWLLKYQPSKALLTDIIDKRSRSETKKKLIKLLKWEKKVRRWWTLRPRAYFTAVVGQRLLRTAVSEEALQKEIDEIDVEVERGVSLHKEQNKDGVPLIFIEAEKETTDQAPGESTADDNGNESDDEVIVVEQVERPPLDDCNAEPILEVQ